MGYPHDSTQTPNITSSSLRQSIRKAVGRVGFSCESIFVFLTPSQVQALRFERKIFLFPSCFGRAYLFVKNRTTAEHYFLIAPETRHSLPAPIRHKKKSEVMRSIEKNRKHRTTAYLPISIKSAGKIALVVLGYFVWGTGFLWVLAGWYLLIPILRGIISLLVGLLTVILVLLALLTFL